MEKRYFTQGLLNSFAKTSVKMIQDYAMKNKEVISRYHMNAKKVTEIPAEISHIAYRETGYFTDIVLDYLESSTGLSSFYRYERTNEEITRAIGDRKHYPYDRTTLVNALKKQYANITLPAEVSRNLDLLLEENTFTITTAHQPCILTGPLYFIYKIVHAIKLADRLSAEIPGNYFVPVFFMGSEDADLEELGHFIVEGKRYEWKTSQSGAVGRMKVDKAFTSLLNELAGQLNVLPFGEEIMSVFRDAYQEGETIQDCTRVLLNALFGKYGLVVLVPDDPALKKLFTPVIKKELQEQFSHQAVEETIGELSRQYKVQAGGRELNLFYLVDDKRERIELEGNVFKVKKLQLGLTLDEILKEAEEHPERFSPNVILRGVFQEMILPGVAFIGGGGEIAYWLELKKVFDVAGVSFPMLVLRNSFLLMHSKQQETISELGFTIHDLFKKPEALLNALTQRESVNQLSLSEEVGELNLFYEQLGQTASAVDPTLADHVKMLQAKAMKRITELEKKMLRAEKKRFEAEKRKVGKLKNAAFPNGSLQERVENVAGFYARQGNLLIDQLYRHSPALEQQFTVITI